jgi:hypothetical protein
MPEEKSLVQIYVAKNVLEASLIRRTFEEHGVPCLIPGEDMKIRDNWRIDDNAIFVPVDRRDEALELLENAWAILHSLEKNREETNG